MVICSWKKQLVLKSLDDVVSLMSFTGYEIISLVIMCKK